MAANDLAYLQQEVRRLQGGNTPVDVFMNQQQKAIKELASTVAKLMQYAKDLEGELIAAGISPDQLKANRIAREIDHACFRQ